MPKNYTSNMKDEALAAVTSGNMSIVEACRKYDIPSSTLRFNLARHNKASKIAKDKAKTMGLVRPRKHNKRHTHKLVNAVKMVVNGEMSSSKAAKLFAIPLSTIKRRVEAEQTRRLVKKIHTTKTNVGCHSHLGELKEAVHIVIKKKLKVEDVAKMFGVSGSTLQRRVSSYRQRNGLISQHHASIKRHRSTSTSTPKEKPKSRVKPAGANHEKKTMEKNVMAAVALHKVTLVAGCCVFCQSRDDNEQILGKKYDHENLTVHYFCMLFASGLCQNGDSEAEGIMGFLYKDIAKEVCRAVRLRCMFCRRNGATIGCVVPRCRMVFHLPCGLKSGVLTQFMGQFCSYCDKHRPRQMLSSDRLAIHDAAKSTCAICMCNVELWSSTNAIRSPCCKNSWFHKECLQHHATCSGLHFFKCPLCNNKDLFQQEMLRFGIYIPDQDAAWESEPNAFQELLTRHNHCDIPTCKCTHGRDYNKENTKWEVMLCDWCGSSGTHLTCSNLKTPMDDWVCQPCNQTCSDLPKGEKIKEKSPPPTRIPKRSVEDTNWIKRKLKALKTPTVPDRCRVKKRKLTMAMSQTHKCVKKKCRSVSSTVTSVMSRSPVTKDKADANHSAAGLSGVSLPAVSLSAKQSQSSPNEVCLEAADTKLYRKKTRRISRYLQRHAESQVKEDLVKQPAWVKKLLGEDFLTGKNLGTKFMEQWKTEESGKMGTNESWDADANGAECSSLVDKDTMMDGDAAMDNPRSSITSTTPRQMNRKARQRTEDSPADLSTMPPWVQRLMSEDFLTGRNLGNKFAEQFHANSGKTTSTEPEALLKPEPRVTCRSESEAQVELKKEMSDSIEAIKDNELSVLQGESALSLPTACKTKTLADCSQALNGAEPTFSPKTPVQYTRVRSPSRRSRLPAEGCVNEIISEQNGETSDLGKLNLSSLEMDRNSFKKRVVRSNLCTPRQRSRAPGPRKGLFFSSSSSLGKSAKALDSHNTMSRSDKTWRSQRLFSSSPVTANITNTTHPLWLQRLMGDDIQTGMKLGDKIAAQFHADTAYYSSGDPVISNQGPDHLPSVDPEPRVLGCKLGSWTPEERMLCRQVQIHLTKMTSAMIRKARINLKRRHRLRLLKKRVQSSKIQLDSGSHQPKIREAFDSQLKKRDSQENGGKSTETVHSELGRIHTGGKLSYVDFVKKFANKGISRFTSYTMRIMRYHDYLNGKFPAEGLLATEIDPYGTSWIKTEVEATSSATPEESILSTNMAIESTSIKANGLSDIECKPILSLTASLSSSSDYELTDINALPVSEPRYIGSRDTSDKVDQKSKFDAESAIDEGVDETFDPTILNDNSLTDSWKCLSMSTGEESNSSMVDSYYSSSTMVDSYCNSSLGDSPTEASNFTNFTMTADSHDNVVESDSSSSSLDAVEPLKMKKTADYDCDDDVVVLDTEIAPIWKRSCSCNHYSKFTPPKTVSAVLPVQQPTQDQYSSDCVIDVDEDIIIIVSDPENDADGDFIKFTGIASPNAIGCDAFASTGNLSPPKLKPECPVISSQSQQKTINHSPVSMPVLDRASVPMSLQSAIQPGVPAKLVNAVLPLLSNTIISPPKGSVRPMPLMTMDVPPLFYPHDGTRYNNQDASQPLQVLPSNVQHQVVTRPPRYATRQYSPNVTINYNYPVMYPTDYSNVQSQQIYRQSTSAQPQNRQTFMQAARGNLPNQQMYANNPRGHQPNQQMYMQNSNFRQTRGQQY